jgi:chemotaxis methyl-accepting protein methylase
VTGNLNRAMNATAPCFAAWLLQETGIDARSLGINALERAVLERVRATGVASTAAALAEGAVDVYWQRLNDSPNERLALIEALVVPETWFFRDREAFVALARLANEKLARDPARVLRVLSVPCSSGEEPYSAAMALLDVGIGAERFTIDAMDISARAIELAQNAVYGRNSFRGGEFGFRERHFSSRIGGWVLNERIQQTVRFAQGNLFETSPSTGGLYDFIFCRNVLIYFQRDAQDRAIHLLDARLAEGGTIFVGPAETGLMMRHALSSARIPLAFAFQRTPPDEAGTRSFALFGKVPDATSASANATALHGVYGTLKPAVARAVAPACVPLPVSSAFVPAASVAAPAISPASVARAKAAALGLRAVTPARAGQWRRQHACTCAGTCPRETLCRLRTRRVACRSTASRRCRAVRQSRTRGAEFRHPERYGRRGLSSARPDRRRARPHRRRERLLPQGALSGACSLRGAHASRGAARHDGRHRRRPATHATRPARRCQDASHGGRSPEPTARRKWHTTSLRIQTW